MSSPKFDGRAHPTPRKKISPYGDDEGLAIQKKMREFDLDEQKECDPDVRDAIPVDQEDEDWQERMYER